MWFAFFHIWTELGSFWILLIVFCYLFDPRRYTSQKFTFHLNKSIAVTQTRMCRFR